MKNKIMKYVLVLLLPILMLIGISFGLYENIKTKRLLSMNDCQEIIVYSTSSDYGISGNGSKIVVTEYCYYFSNKKFISTHTRFTKPVPNNTPVWFRFSPKDPKCYKFLFDSIVLVNNSRIRYQLIENTKNYTILSSKPLFNY